MQKFFKFLKEIKEKKNIDVSRIALFNENTLWGNETPKLETKLIEEKGYNLVR